MRVVRRASVLNILAAIPLFVAFLLVVSGINHRLQSASLASVSVTSSNPRPSFRGALGTGSAGTTAVIDTDPGDYPSTSSAQLVSGDEVSIGQGGTLVDYTVASASSLSTFTTTTALGAGEDDAGDDVIATSAATLTARFTTVNAIPNGRFRVLVPAVSNTGAASDGIPDGGAFDFSTSTPTVTCPSNADATYDFVTGVATAAAQQIGSQWYHVFECAYSGTGAVGTAFNGTNGIVIGDGTANLINPAPKANHTTGTADTYNVIIQQLDSSLNVQDQTTVQIAVIEAVRITASVAPQITFQIIGVNSGVSACGLTTSVATTPSTVPFGEVQIASFTNAAQSLSVSTNAAGGYVVTSSESNQLARLISGTLATCTGDPTTDTDCIPDSRGDGGTMSNTVKAAWDLTATKGFGYSLDNVNTVASPFTPAFEYSDTDGACSGGTYCAKQFSDNEAGEAPQTIFSNTGPADNDNLYVCYKVIISAVQAAGDYENYVTYNATATF